MKEQYLVIAVDLTIMFGILSWTEESTQAAIISFVSGVWAIRLFGKIFSEMLQEYQDFESNKPL